MTCSLGFRAHNTRENRCVTDWQVVFVGNAFATQSNQLTLFEVLRQSTDDVAHGAETVSQLGV